MTRQRKMFPTAQCAHVWAQCNQDSGHNASNSVSFFGRLFYSYNTPIAHILDTPRGERVALVSAEGYSMTTKSKHLTAVRRAVRGAVAADFTVPYIDIDSRGQYTAPRECEHFLPGSLDTRDAEARAKAMHALNLQWLVQQYTDAVAQLMRSQVVGFNGQYAIDRLDYLATAAHQYAHHFGLPFPQLKPEDSMRPVLERIERLRSDPKRMAKAAAREAARQRGRLEQAKLTAERNAYRIEQFRLGAPNVGHVSDADGCAMLRLSRDESRVETSWGAQAPLSHVRYALEVYSQVMEAKATPWTPGTSAIKLGSFQLDEIRADGSVRCGCHTITGREIELLRLELSQLTNVES